MGPQARPRHARRPGPGGWAGRMAKLRFPGPPAGRQAVRVPARRDPLVHPVAITEHCVIGDQIRVPAAWCDMTDCRARFAHPAALGEADNRTRALASGWGRDAYGRLLCPACQQQRHAPAEREVIARDPETAGARTPADSPAGSRGRVRPSVRSLLAGWQRAVAPGRHGGTQWPLLLLALATGRNGWAAPHGATVPDRRPKASRSERDHFRLHRSRGRAAQAADPLGSRFSYQGRPGPP